MAKEEREVEDHPQQQQQQQQHLRADMGPVPQQRVTLTKAQSPALNQANFVESTGTGPIQEGVSPAKAPTAPPAGEFTGSTAASELAPPSASASTSASASAPAPAPAPAPAIPSAPSSTAATASSSLVPGGVDDCQRPSLAASQTAIPPRPPQVDHGMPLTLSALFAADAKLEQNRSATLASTPSHEEVKLTTTAAARCGSPSRTRACVHARTRARASTRPAPHHPSTHSHPCCSDQSQSRKLRWNYCVRSRPNWPLIHRPPVPW